MWNLPPPPGFVGLDSQKPLTTYQRRLPHWRQDGATYFVTFRQQDSLPQSKLKELRAIKEDWERRNPPPRTDEVWEQFLRTISTKVEVWLDQGFGACKLQDERAAKIVVDAMHHFDGGRFFLGCYVVMPNHVHVVVRPLLAVWPLEKVLQSWKSYISRQINRLFGEQGELWQEESFDRIVRDEEHLYRVIQYIGKNPKRANMDPDAIKIWIRPEWQAAGWDFEKEL